MKKQITTIALGILMVAGAMAMYAGDTLTFETELINPVYTVAGNSSSLEGLNIVLDGRNITISPVLNYKPDNFTIIFFDNITKEVEKIIYRGGGGTRTKYVDKNVTVYVPEYINTTETIEVERIVNVPTDNTIVIEKGYELWQIILGAILGVALGWAVLKKKKEKTAEEIMEEIE